MPLYRASYSSLVYWSITVSTVRNILQDIFVQEFPAYPSQENNVPKEIRQDLG